MLYKGNFIFNKSNHAGECEIDNKNNITITINESDLVSVNTKIVGFASNENLAIYKAILIDNGVGYYKLQAYYMVKHKIPLKYKNVNFINHIKQFRFTFKPLNEWLQYKTIEQNENTISFSIPNDITLYNSDKLTIKIKYYKEISQIENNHIDSINIVPYICVSSSKEVSVEQIKKYVQMITRFFATLIGYTSNVNIIKFIKNYKGKSYFEKFEDELTINCDFSNCFDVYFAYNTFNLRTSYKDINDDLNSMFKKWFDIYTNSRFKESIINYFNPYKSNTLEEEYLKLTKCIEKISIAKENKKEIIIKNKKLHNIISNFYKDNKEDLISRLKDSNFKKKYIDKIDEIHEEVANCIVYKYSHRIDLAKRLKDSDTYGELKQKFNIRHVTKPNNDLSIYNYLANTRNYYTHLDDDKYIIKNNYIPMYCRMLEKILVRELLEFIINDNEYIKNVIKNDKYLMAYDY